MILLWFVHSELLLGKKWQTVVFESQHAITNARAEGLNLRALAPEQDSELRRSEYAGKSAH